MGVISNALSLVRIEVFPERDGNLCNWARVAYNIIIVRIEVFPERDGNSNRGACFITSDTLCPNRGLP